MKLFGRISLLFALLFWACILRAQNASCGCPQTEWTIDQAKAKADVIFVGKVIRLITNPNKAGWNVTFKADSSWIRPIDPYPTLFTDYEDHCGYPFREGQTYLVYLNQHHVNFTTGICDRTASLSDPRALEDIQYLGKAFSPEKPASLFKNALILSGMALFALIFVAWIVIRKKKTPPQKV